MSYFFVVVHKWTSTANAFYATICAKTDKMLQKKGSRQCCFWDNKITRLFTVFYSFKNAIQDIDVNMGHLYVSLLTILTTDLCSAGNYYNNLVTIIKTNVIKC